mmetsp:Transcript_11099/g.12154  ORF Transcript_11099/g.12154 Transcript_11099/m.12154 type:complete len:1009 (-) Transcript_11099:26-3052(-)
MVEVLGPKILASICDFLSVNELRSKVWPILKRVPDLCHQTHKNLTIISWQAQDESNEDWEFMVRLFSPKPHEIEVVNIATEKHLKTISSLINVVPLQSLRELTLDISPQRALSRQDRELLLLAIRRSSNLTSLTVNEPGTIISRSIILAIQPLEHLTSLALSTISLSAKDPNPKPQYKLQHLSLNKIPPECDRRHLLQWISHFTSSLKTFNYLQSISIPLPNRLELTPQFPQLTHLTAYFELYQTPHFLKCLLSNSPQLQSLTLNCPQECCPESENYNLCLSSLLPTELKKNIRKFAFSMGKQTVYQKYGEQVLDLAREMSGLRDLEVGFMVFEEFRCGEFCEKTGLFGEIGRFYPTLRTFSGLPVKFDGVDQGQLFDARYFVKKLLAMDLPVGVKCQYLAAFWGDLKLSLKNFHFLKHITLVDNGGMGFCREFCLAEELQQWDFNSPIVLDQFTETSLLPVVALLNEISPWKPSIDVLRLDTNIWNDDFVVVKNRISWVRNLYEGTEILIRSNEMLTLDQFTEMVMMIQPSRLVLGPKFWGSQTCFSVSPLGLNNQFAPVDGNDKVLDKMKPIEALAVLDCCVKCLILEGPRFDSEVLAKVGIWNNLDSLELHNTRKKAEEWKEFIDKLTLNESLQTLKLSNIEVTDDKPTQVMEHLLLRVSERLLSLKVFKFSFEREWQDLDSTKAQEGHIDNIRLLMHRLKDFSFDYPNQASSGSVLKRVAGFAYQMWSSKEKANLETIFDQEITDLFATLEEQKKINFLHRGHSMSISQLFKLAVIWIWLEDHHQKIIVEFQDNSRARSVPLGWSRVPRPKITVPDVNHLTDFVLLALRNALAPSNDTIAIDGIFAKEREFPFHLSFFPFTFRTTNPITSIVIERVKDQDLVTLLKSAQITWPNLENLSVTHTITKDLDFDTRLKPQILSLLCQFNRLKNLKVSSDLLATRKDIEEFRGEKKLKVESIPFVNILPPRPQEGTRRTRGFMFSDQRLGKMPVLPNQLCFKLSTLPK